MNEIVCVLFPLWIAPVTLDQAAALRPQGLQNKLLDRRGGRLRFRELSSSASLQRRSTGSLGPPQPARYEPPQPMEEMQCIKITVDGHLTKAPELRKTTSCKSVTRFDLAHNFREHVGKDFSDVATIFFSASVWEEDGAVEVAELGLTKGSRVSVDGLWSKRTWITKDGERRINDVLTVTKVRLFTETEVGRPDAVDDDAEPTPDEAIAEPAA
ncbi:MAG TPA: single-stranded DNA-binding protein [Propionibacteriaceae bacterium]|nr:single-stranded DNA-binding protein [Propionibacteriaceae bacterium]